MNTIHIEAGEPISIVVEGDTLNWQHEDAQTKEECAELINTASNPVTEWEPLGIAGRLTCSKCGLDGAISKGTFIRIFKREPGQTVGEGYAAWKRYLHESREDASRNQKRKGSSEQERT